MFGGAMLPGKRTKAFADSVEDEVEDVKAQREVAHAQRLAEEDQALLESGEVSLAPAPAAEAAPVPAGPPAPPEPEPAPTRARYGGGGAGKLIREGRELQTEGQAQVSGARDSQKGHLAAQREALDAGTERREGLGQELKTRQAESDVDEAVAREEYEMEREALEPERTKAEAKANAEIDNDRFWKNATAGEKIQMGVANIFSSLGAGLIAAGGGGYVGNTAAKAIQKRIDRDIDAQKKSIEQGMAQLERLDRKDSKLYRELQDSLGRVDAARDRAQQNYATELRALAANTDDQLQREQLGIAADQLDITTGKETEARGVQKESRGQRMRAAAAAARARAEAAKARAAEKERDRQFQLQKIAYREQMKGSGQAKSYSLPDASYVGEGSPTREGYSATAKARIGWLDQDRIAADLQREAAKLTTMDRASGEWSKQYAKVNGLAKMMETKVAKGFGGVITEGDKASAREIIGNIGKKIISPNELTRLEQFRSSIRQNYADIGETYGYKVNAGTVGPKNARVVE